MLQTDDGRSALRRLFADRPALMILDVGLPGLDGWQVLERTRDLTDLPVILLSAHSGEGARVRGLRAGADDFLPKPFGNDELLARVETLLRRAATARWAGGGTLGDERLRLVPERRSALWHGVEVRLSDIEFRLLQTLVRNRGRVVTTEQLLDQVWGDAEGRERVKVRGATSAAQAPTGRAPAAAPPTAPNPPAHPAAPGHAATAAHPEGPGHRADPTDPLEAVRGLGYRYREPGSTQPGAGEADTTGPGATQPGAGEPGPGPPDGA